MFDSSYLKYNIIYQHKTSLSEKNSPVWCIFSVFTENTSSGTSKFSYYKSNLYKLSQDVFHCFISGSAGPYTSVMDYLHCLLCTSICVYVRDVLSFEDTVVFTTVALLFCTPAGPYFYICSLTVYNWTIIPERWRNIQADMCSPSLQYFLYDVMFNFNYV